MVEKVEKACPFCNLDAEKNRVLYETDTVVVILSNPRLMPGHVLVIPKVHAGAIFELELAVREDVFETALRFQQKMTRIFSERWGKAAGCDVSWHTRPFMPQTELSVPGHAHVHIRPRYWMDPFYEAVSKHETAVFQPLADEEKEEYQKLLREE